MTSPTNYHTHSCDICARHLASIRGCDQDAKNLRARIRRLYRNYRPATSTLEDLRDAVTPLQNALHDIQATGRRDRRSLARHMEEVG